jgi:serine/threonine protein kinase
MESCPMCFKEISSLKFFQCKFCERNCCSLSCLINHAQAHQKNPNLSINLVNSLKRRQSENLTEQYSFITSGDFRDKINYEKKYNFNNFTKVIEGIFPKQLGSGSFGRVFLVSHNETKELFALKTIEKRKIMMTYGKLDIIYDEINIHSKLYHQNIIKLYSVYEDDETINIILEYAKGGNLYQLIKDEKNGFSESKAFDYFIQVINAVYYLHSNNIIHRDIKPENILIGDDNKLKLCDFGWAKELTLENRSTFCGTMEYMAPEIVGSENYDYSVDIWSLGILLYEMLFGHSPFNGKDTNNIILNIKSHELNYDDTNKKISNSCKDLIQKLLNMNPQKRLKIKDILEHPFIKKHSKKFLSNKQLTNSINEDKIENQLNKKLNDTNNSSNKKEDVNLNGKKLIRSNTINKMFPNSSEQKFSLKLFSSKELLNKNIKGKESTNKIQKIHAHKSNKQLAILAKFRYSLNVQLEKAKKSIGNINFQSSKNCTFEDIRDSQLLNEKKDIYKRFKKFKSSKYTNYYLINNLNTEECKNKNSIDEKNETDNKNIIFENDFEDIVDGAEEIAAIKRLNKVYAQYEKKNGIANN